jgi:hypothetical protein
MNGNSGSGMAAAEAENATAPIATAAKAAAVREFNFNAPRLNIARPPVWSLARHSAHWLAAPLQGKGFRAFALKAQNGFVELGNCFIAVLREAKLSGSLPLERQFSRTDLLDPLALRGRSVPQHDRRYSHTGVATEL